MRVIPGSLVSKGPAVAAVSSWTYQDDPYWVAMNEYFWFPQGGLDTLSFHWLRR